MIFALMPILLVMIFALLLSGPTKSKILFALFLVAFSAWAVVSELAFYAHPSDLVYVVRGVFFLGCTMSTSYLVFVHEYVESNMRLLSPYTISMYLLALSICLSPYAVQDIVVSATGVISISFGISVFLIWLYVLLCTYFTIRLILEYSRAPLPRVAIKRVLAFTLLVLFLTPITNAIFTDIFQTDIFAKSSFLYLTAIYAAAGLILFNKDFLKIDKRVLVNVFYFMILGLFVGLYLYLALSYITNLTLGVVLSIVFGLCFIPAKRYFDEFTDRVFFHKSYETKDVLDRLADALINQDNLEHLLRDSLNIYGHALHPTHSYAFAVNNQKVIAQFKSGRNYNNISLEHILRVDPSAKAAKVDDLTDAKLKAELSRNEIELMSTTSRNGEVNGIYLFGLKANGASYMPQDVELLNISGKNLAVAIENATRFAQIAKFNEQLKEEIKVATKKLRVSNKKLVSLDKTKDEFMSIASHQLRTPLTTIKNLTLLLRDGKFGSINKEQKEALSTQYVSVDRMVSLVQDFLNASSIENGRFEVRKNNTSLNELIVEAIDQSVQVMEDKGLKLKTNIQAEDMVLNVDRRKIKEVMMNFIDNAVQYTPEGGDISISMKADGAYVDVLIKDRGIGVPKDEQPGLFSKSFRASNAKKDRPDGTGLGLFLAKKIIDSHGGEIIFRSELNKGSTFGFKLPLSN